MSYGFRVYSFQVTERNRRIKSAIDLGGGTNKALADALVSAWSTTEVRDGLPLWRTLLDEMPAVGLKGDDRIRGISATSSADSAQLEIHHGRIGQSPFLLHSEGDPQNISTGAPAHGLRHDFYFPSHGKQGILVAEIVSRHSAVAPLLAWTSRLEGIADESETPLWHRYHIDPLGDTGLLESIITNARKVTAEFRGTKLSPSGKPGPPLELSLPVDDSAHAAVAKVILDWMQGNPRKPVNRLLKALKFNPTQVGKAHMSFTVPKIHLDGEEKATITPENLNDIFTYTISRDIRPSADTWTDRTSAKVKALAEAWDIPLVDGA